jgi:hypothetical protein
MAMLYRQSPVSLSRSRAHNTHSNPPMALKQCMGQPWTITCSGQQPDARLVNRRVVHQDVRRRQKQP